MSAVEPSDYAIQLENNQTPAFITAIVVAICMAAGAVFLVLHLTKSPSEKGEPANEQTRGVAGGRGGGRAAGTDRMRNRGGRRRPERQPEPESTAATVYGDGEPDVMQSGSEEEDDDEDDAGGRRGGRRRQERRDAQEAERAAREARANKRNAYDEKRAQKDREREEKEAQKELERKLAEEERQKAEDEEAAKWMGMISVENAGSGQTEAEEETSGLLGQFITYIQERKMVPLEDIANEFKLRTTDVLNRIQGLEAMGRITGILDERGKFIYIQPEEMQKFADFIKKRGRVSIAELAAKSSNFIDLEPKAAHAVTSVPLVDFDSLLAQTEPGTA